MLSTLEMMRSTKRYGSWIGSKSGLRGPSTAGRKERLLIGIGSIAPSAKRRSICDKVMIGQKYQGIPINSMIRQTVYVALIR